MLMFQWQRIEAAILGLLNPELLSKFLFYYKTELEIENHCDTFSHSNKRFLR